MKKISYFLIMMQSVADSIVGLVSLPLFTIFSFRRATTRYSLCIEMFAVGVPNFIINNNLTRHDGGKVLWCFTPFEISNIHNKEKNSGVLLL